MIESNDKFNTVLIVDDTAQNLTILGEILSPHYHIKIANNGMRALKIANTLPYPDLILLDIMMPEMDGFEVLRQLKSNESTASIPVIFLTALSSTDNETRGLSLGAVDYITKPLNPDITLARIKTQLELKNAKKILEDANTWLKTQVEKKTTQNNIIKKTTIRALANVAESKDNDTGNHILRTQNYIKVLANELSKNPKYATQLSPEYIDLITDASPLHDIGKVGIPDEILNKPGKLNPEEWEIMKTHTTIGAKAIWNAIKDIQDKTVVEFLQVGYEIALSHHEYWDGTGYPYGLSGSDIPLSARLMAIADVYDALVSRRVYKSAFTEETVLEIIDNASGKQFDPDIIIAFKKVKNDFATIKQQLNDE